MRTFLTLITMPFTTLIAIFVFWDFYISIALSVGLAFAAYMFWDKFVEYMEVGKNER